MFCAQSDDESVTQKPQLWTGPYMFMFAGTQSRFLVILLLSSHRSCQHASSWPRDQHACVLDCSSSLPPHCCTNMHSEQPRGPASESPLSPSATDHSTVQFVAVHKNWASLMKTLRQACDSICVLSAHAMSRALFSILVSCPQSCRPTASVSPDRIMLDGKDITVHPVAVSYDG